MLGTRLYGPWETVAEYDALMANWDRVGEFDLTEAEQSAIEEAFRLLIPDEIADWTWNPVRFATAVYDPAALEKLTGVPTAELAEQVASFQLDDVTMLSGEGPCWSLSAPVESIRCLSWTQSSRRRRSSDTGASMAAPGSGAVAATIRPLLPSGSTSGIALTTGQCTNCCANGVATRAITLQERLAAAEAETSRLEALVNRLIGALADKGDLRFARTIVEELENERITPDKIRPVVERQPTPIRDPSPLRVPPTPLGVATGCR